MSLLGYLHVYQTSSHKMLGLCTQSTTTVSTEKEENKKENGKKSGTRESAKNHAVSFQQSDYTFAQTGISRPQPRAFPCRQVQIRHADVRTGAGVN